MSCQHTGVPHGRICSGKCACCHTEKEVPYQTCYLIQSQCTDTRPASPNPTTSGTWQSSHQRTRFSSHWYGSTGDTSQLTQWLQCKMLVTFPLVDNYPSAAFMQPAGEHTWLFTHSRGFSVHRLSTRALNCDNLAGIINAGLSQAPYKTCG